MRNALKSFADTNGWKNLEAGTAIKTLSETDNIRTVSIKVESGYDNGKVSLYYTTNVIENLTPNYTSKDHDAFQKAISYINGRQHDSLGEANAFLNGWVKKLNKMKIK